MKTETMVKEIVKMDVVNLNKKESTINRILVCFEELSLCLLRPSVSRNTRAQMTDSISRIEENLMKLEETVFGEDLAASFKRNKGNVYRSQLSNAVLNDANRLFLMTTSNDSQNSVKRFFIHSQAADKSYKLFEREVDVEEYLLDMCTALNNI